MREISILNRKYKVYGLHLILWSILLLLNYFFFRRPGFSIDFTFNILNWAIYLTLFYINYSFLIPFFLFRKKYFYYLLLLLLFFSSIGYLKTEIDHKYFSEFARKEWRQFTSERQMQKMPPIPGMEPVPPPFKNKMPFRMSLMPELSQLFLIVLASTSLRFIQKWQDDEKLKSEIEKEKISTELSFLKQQINPHFLFNAINSIYSLSLSKKSDAPDAILKLSSILRYMLYESEKEFVTLNNEIQVITDYIELQKLRMTSKVRLTYNFEGNFEQYSIAPLLLIPLIENAFKHGVDNANNSFIDIRIGIENYRLELHVKNKIVQTKEENIRNSGIGIKNIIRRLELLYANVHKFEAHRDNDTFIVHLSLDLNHKNELHSY
jgi:two-component system, LytTR family, sensor kinase